MDGERDERLERLRDSAQLWLGSKDPSVGHGALIETAFLMACADGELAGAEHEQLVATIEFITGQQFSAEQLRAMVDQMLGALQTDGWDARIETIAQNLPDPTSRRNAYRLAAGVSFVDGQVQDTEAQLFGLLAQAFGIPDAEATQILTEVRDELFAED